MTARPDRERASFAVASALPCRKPGHGGTGEQRGSDEKGLQHGGHTGVLNPDRRYLYAMVESVVGLQPAESMPRVDHAIDSSRVSLHRARVAAVLQAFFIGAALFAGAAVAWFAAWEGGRDRERGTFPIWSRRHA